MSLILGLIICYYSRAQCILTTSGRRYWYYEREEYVRGIKAVLNLVNVNTYAIPKHFEGYHVVLILLSQLVSANPTPLVSNPLHSQPHCPDNH